MKDNGRRIWVFDGIDILLLLMGFYYGVGKYVVNNLVDDDNVWYNYDVIEGESGRKIIVVY